MPWEVHSRQRLINPAPLGHPATVFMISYQVTFLVWHMLPRSSGPHSIGMTTISNLCGGSFCGSAYSVSLLKEITQYINLDFRFSLTLHNPVWIGLMLCGPHLMCRFNNLSLLNSTNLFLSYMAYISCYIAAMPLLPTMSMAI